jgi:predicted PolB exonuclease-like 3'-5' exonuclease
MQPNKQNISNILAIVLICCLCAGLGYYFGSKVSTKEMQDKQKVEIAKVVENVEKKTENIIAKDIPGVQWIKANTEPKCDALHPIKGVYRGDSAFYYTKNYKNYDKTKPDMCFATEEFARDTVGLIKKF